MEKSQTNATNVTMPPSLKEIWEHILNHTVEKSQINVTMPHPLHVILGDIWKYTVEKRKTNAINVTMPLMMQAIWGNI